MANKMEMKRNRIKLTGILDRSLAESLVEEVERLKSNQIIEADASEIQDAEIDALALLRQKANESGKWKVLFKGLNRGVSRSFSLLGFKSGSGHAVIESEPDYSENLPTTFGKIDVKLVYCPGCEKPLATKASGLHACPHCGSRFKVNEHGQAIKYEPLRIPGKKKG